jgi:branched-chain amino acid transport system substrate-binding protein
VLQKKGVSDVKLVAEKADAADFTPALTSATRNNPDVVVAVFPAQGCARIMQARAALGIKARFFFPGSCAEQSVLDAAGGGADGAYFASGFLPYSDEANPEVATYLAKRRAHGAGDVKPSVLSQAGFATVMDLRQLLGDLKGQLTAAALTTELRTARDRPGFMSHTYTCDRQQVLLLSAVCNANVRLLQERGGRLTDVTGNWVNGADLIRLFTG